MKKLLILFLSMHFLIGCGATDGQIDAGLVDDQGTCNQDLNLIYGGDTPETIQTYWYCKTDYEGPKNFTPDNFPLHDSRLMIFKNGQGLLSKNSDDNFPGELQRFDSHDINDNCSITLNLLDGREVGLYSIYFFPIDSDLYLEFKTSQRSYICKKLDGSDMDILWNVKD